MALAITRIMEKVNGMGAFCCEPVTIITAITAVIGAFTAFKGASDAEDAREQALAEERRANAARERQQNLEQQQQRRRQIRAAREETAVAVNAAAVQGVQPSSITAGAIGGVQTQLAGNLGFLSRSSANATELNAAIDARQQALSDVATGNAVAGLGETIFSNAGTIGRNVADIGSIFGGGGGTGTA